MSGGGPEWYLSAETVRQRNQELDRELLHLFEEAPPDRIHELIGDEWTVAHNLAHIAEFPDYFARQLHEWVAGERVVVGRVAEWDADRNDALAQAGRQSLSSLVRSATRSFRRLAEVLDALEDDHLAAMTQNVKYGQEPLSAFLDRYLIGHKAAHVEQLRRALRDLSSS